MDDTGISWAKAGMPRGSSWNPTYGCAVCSPGCKNCYAMRIAGRFSFPGAPYEGLVTIGKNKKAVWNGQGFLKPEALLIPLKWRSPRGVFVDSMSDLFFEPILDEEIGACFGVMAAARQHRYLILTKRARRMRQWYEWYAKRVETAAEEWSGRDCAVSLHDAVDECGALEAWDLTKAALDGYVSIEHSVWNADVMNRGDADPFPFPHVWQGVSVYDKKHGLPRIDELREVDVAVRWLSIEPLLEDLGTINLAGIHWVVIGCESGPRARVCKPEWIRNIIAQCKEAGVPVWLKQLEHTPGKFIPVDALGRKCSATLEVGADTGSKTKARGPAGGQIVELPYLDGVQYAEFPKVAA